MLWGVCMCLFHVCFVSVQSSQGTFEILSSVLLRDELREAWLPGEFPLSARVCAELR